MSRQSKTSNKRSSHKESHKPYTGGEHANSSKKWANSLRGDDYSERKSYGLNNS